jgi:hypothetical protein
MNARGCALTVVLLASAQLAIGGGDPAGATHTVQRCQRAPVVFPALIVDGRIRNIEITADDIDPSPAWDPASSEEVPVTVAQATRLGTEEFHRKFGAREGWHITEVSFRPLCDNHWIYSVDWTASGTDETGFVLVTVLLSGKVVSLDRAQPQGSGKR